MTTLPYEILLRWTDDGKFAGGHTVLRNPATANLLPAQPLGSKLHPWPEVLGLVNDALAEQNAVLLAENARITEDANARVTKAESEAETATKNAQEQTAAARGEVETARNEYGRLLAALQNVAGYLAEGSPSVAEAAAYLQTALLPEREREAAALRARLAQLETKPL